MSPEVKAFYAAFVALIKAYPHIVIWLASLAVIAATHFGLHLTTDQVIAVAGAVVTAATAVIHLTMTANPHVPSAAPEAPAVTAVDIVKALAPVVTEVEQDLAADLPEAKHGHTTDPVVGPAVVAAPIGPGAPQKHP